MKDELNRLARNLWWTTDNDAIELWERIDGWRWVRSRHNPVALLADVEPDRWRVLEADRELHALAEAVLVRFRREVGEGPRIAASRVGYLSMEYGLHESLRVYSGGLGVLAGDHVRSASDLGIPLVAIGILYRRGYFRQVVDDGRQTPAYPAVDTARLPLQLARGSDDQPLRIFVPIGDADVAVHIWELHVGRSVVLLLDTDIHGNADSDRALTSDLYGGDANLRIHQEVLLGIGGIRAARALGANPAVWHLNEGHTAFATLELAREARPAAGSWDAAFAEARRHVVFTTHTPVPAGHDRFPRALVEEALGRWCTTAEIGVDAVLQQGRERQHEQDAPLCMTALALRGSRAHNGVSAIHGRVSRDMWQGLTPDGPQPAIGHVTNGVHPVFWTGVATRRLFDHWLPGWRQTPWEPAVWQPIDRIPDELLWELRAKLRQELCNRVAASGGPLLDPQALTIGFARRFAAYKRGTMVFRDPDRLASWLHSVPAQIVFAGKAHPRDMEGQAILADIIRFSRSRPFRDRVAFLEDYDIEIGRALTCGADVWLNNPRRPLEASGTSGQKAALNGGLNASILDGWWAEAWDGTNGFAIGQGEEHAAVAEGDQADANALYAVLEKEIGPLWCERNAHGLSKGWVGRVRRAILTCGPAFNSTRMVRDYLASYALDA